MSNIPLPAVAASGNRAQVHITIVNPWSLVDRSTIRRIVGWNARLQFASDLWDAVDLQSAHHPERHFVITSVACPRELQRVLSDIDFSCPIRYVFLVGPQAGGDDALAAHIAKGGPTHH